MIPAMSRRRNTGLRRALLPVLLTVMAAIQVRAHDLERTTVHLQVFADGSFSLRLAHDPSWLLLRMESFAGGSTSTTDPIARDWRLQELAPQIIDRVVLFVDGHEIRPTTAEYTPPSDSVPPGEVALASYTLHGRLPQYARGLRWYYGMVVDPYPFSIQLVDGSSTTELVQGDAWSTLLRLGGPSGRPSLVTRLRDSIWLGYTHVLPRGIDHLLFALGLFLVCGRIRPAIMQVTTFTVAQSLTLGLSLHGFASLPVRLVEPFMVLPVVYVALDNLQTRTTPAVRTALIGAFGALHGIAMAGAFTSVPSLRTDGAALVGLNGGVGLGLMTVVFAAAVLVAGWSERAWYRSRVVVPASLTIATVGVCWTVLQVMQ
jgi:hypothetical protein